MGNLVKAGMLERERPDETLKIEGEHVWGPQRMDREREQPMVADPPAHHHNLIPSNQVKGECQASRQLKTGYAPMWWQMALVEDEVVLCYGEDVKHCFRIYSHHRQSGEDTS